MQEESDPNPGLGLEQIDAEMRGDRTRTRRATRAQGGFDANPKKTFGVAPGEER